MVRAGLGISLGVVGLDVVNGFGWDNGILALAPMLLAGVVICHPHPLEGGIPTFFLAILVILLSLLIVSNLKYRNLFQFNFHRTTNMFVALSAAVIISACILYPLCFLLLALLYVLSGPVKLVLGFFKQPVVEEQR